MKIDLTLINKTGYKFAADCFEQLAAKIIGDELKIPHKNQVPALGLVLTQGEEIKDLNRRFRGNDAKTDVLSFAGEFTETGDLGDIIIDIEMAYEQKGNQSLAFEVQSLFVHGLLHLLGYDHINEKMKSEMQLKENIFNKEIKE